MSQLTPEYEAEIRAREAAATPGNWTEIAVVDHEGCSVWPWEKEADMLFAYHARADVPALLAEVDALRVALNNEWLRNHDDTCDNTHKCSSFGGAKKCTYPNHEKAN